MKKGLERGLCLEIGGLSSPLSNILVKGGRMCQKGDPFGHNHFTGNRLPYFKRELSAPFLFFNQSF